MVVQGVRKPTGMVELQLGGIEQLCALFERQYLGAAGRAGGASRAADAGDVIVYDWDGDGAFQHSTIVTAFDAGGKPLVNAHTVSSRHRYWDYRDSYAWNDNTEYRFYHIPDYFKMTACRAAIRTRERLTWDRIN